MLAFNWALLDMVFSKYIHVEIEIVPSIFCVKAIFNFFSKIQLKPSSHIRRKSPRCLIIVFKKKFNVSIRKKSRKTKVKSFLKIMNLRDAGGDKKQITILKNCTNPPIIKNNEVKSFLDIVAPPQLHLIFGVVNTV